MYINDGIIYKKKTELCRKNDRIIYKNDKIM